MNNLHKFLISTGCLIYLFFVFLIDYYLHFEIVITILNLIPILIVTWYISSRSGYVFSFLAVELWIVAELMSYDYSDMFIIFLIDSCLSLVFFMGFVKLTGQFKKILHQQTNYAITDSLTEILNARGFYQKVKDELLRAARFKRPLTLIYADLDNFKTINDTLGHSTGDQLLKLVAQYFKQALRSNDIIGRIGGDEFSLLLVETGVEESRVIIQRLLKDINQIMSERQWPVSVSFGAVCYPIPPQDIKFMLQQADRLMYEVKNTTKNDFKLMIAQS